MGGTTPMARMFRSGRRKMKKNSSYTTDSFFSRRGSWKLEWITRERNKAAHELCFAALFLILARFVCLKLFLRPSGWRLPAVLLRIGNETIVKHKGGLDPDDLVNEGDYNVDDDDEIDFFVNVIFLTNDDDRDNEEIIEVKKNMTEF
ncbi:hypothetical protein NL676_029870 [Syzygium grande]|nr:hypothetical protein NL676_029870 [Syzygium grande]